MHRIPKAYIQQPADSVLISQQNDSSIIDTSVPGITRQDSADFQQAGSILEPGSGISDSSISRTSDTVSGPLAGSQDSIVTDSSARTFEVLNIQIPADTNVSDNPYETEPGWNINRDFLADNPLTQLQFYKKHDSLVATTIIEELRSKPAIDPDLRSVRQESWLTVLLLCIIFLFIWIRVFYGKIYSLLADSIVNFQISVKLYLEHNVLNRRFSLLLDVIYLLVFAVFLYQLISYFNLLESNIHNVFLYGIILSTWILYSLVRIAILYLTGFIFNVRTVFAEYVHHTFIYNKGLGIVLFPVVAIALFIPPDLVLFVLVLGLIVYVFAVVFKAVRAYRLIKRKDILLFYMILYLCTLEILPLLLGYKVMKSVILSY